jgi:hypothetical protein
MKPVAKSDRFNLGELFDRAGRLRPLNELPANIQAEIASFEIVRMRVRDNDATVTTEELIRVKTRDRRTAQITKRGQTTGTARTLTQGAVRPRLVTTIERSAGSGSTAAVQAYSEADAEP